MLLGRVSQHDISLDAYQRADGQTFKVTAQLFELPAEYDYWQAAYDAEHDQWGHMRFVLTVPKKIAATLDFARAIVSGSAFEQVKSCLNNATDKGRDLAACFALDGWVLI
ncbi:MULTISPECIES: hypothetical protein [Burkholderia]|uniref:Uncharacterized protein n=1 Tax=Burkholderia aenigmatica TaxID=2015348 RepID=A0ABY6Y0T8_9BURK|nr:MULTISPECIES: hypothetical protein [Burkholderia]VWD16874.1 hypothetical protein BLA17378_06307 [Burkholderia aenigmatica]VWD19110.1 hypothetical protein BLA18628_03760 [Burkholderia aenigmatica]